MNIAIPTPGVRRRSITGLWLRHAVAFVRYWKFVITWVLVEPVVVLVAVGFGIGKLVSEVEGGLSYAEFVTPALIMGSAMFHALFETSWNAYNRIDNDVYETALTTPLTVTEITLGDILWAVSRSLMTTIGVAVFAVVFGWLGGWAAVGILIPAVMVGVVFGTMGFLFSAVAPHTTFLSLVFTLVATPMYFFSGSFFPISILPDWVEPIAWAMPLTPGVHLARGFALGNFDLTHLWSAIYMVVLTLIMWPAAIYLLKRRLIK
ncbi:MAG: ABC transporter permease [Dehalococcoidia bacterium]|jgi:lipooligosaccharide transport system permease protein|nr:ABC transporter permease [Dehalococcoidia bacterium]